MYLVLYVAVAFRHSCLTFFAWRRVVLSFSTRNNCCEFLAFYGVNTQNVFQSLLRCWKNDELFYWDLSLVVRNSFTLWQWSPRPIYFSELFLAPTKFLCIITVNATQNTASSTEMIQSRYELFSSNITYCFDTYSFRSEIKK